jgi:hypothetical protein
MVVLSCGEVKINNYNEQTASRIAAAGASNGSTRRSAATSGGASQSGVVDGCRHTYIAAPNSLGADDYG